MKYNMQINYGKEYKLTMNVTDIRLINESDISDIFRQRASIRYCLPCGYSVYKSNEGELKKCWLNRSTRSKKNMFTDEKLKTFDVPYVPIIVEATVDQTDIEMHPREIIETMPVKSDNFLLVVLKNGIRIDPDTVKVKMIMATKAMTKYIYGKTRSICSGIEPVVTTEVEKHVNETIAKMMIYSEK